ncbi:isopentenyl-diphosphate Delta-isomerase [Arachidicoccus soli]|uniref:Isopentenyl-diphosphate delta-isomerase n=1 Tax=Arachidicoccus soli TaxID=2341117 RepID=A0A386HQQ8_9BACT|nr:isopentenyl-diphosphate Delta-isomerase [Arachidicoccus soli]AYD47830.1 isopentenyl-diphosphate Delta-isomerase [Arachidicoccus soli]
MNEMLILVDNADNALGFSDKMSVHREGILHRAFSVFIFNSKGELLLQKRAEDKYHSGGLWTNTVCSHPRKDEDTSAAVKRRLYEEMGLMCTTKFQFSFIYKEAFENGLTEHELDHVYFGISDAIPIPNPEEVCAWRYVNLKELSKDIHKNPHQYSAWLRICLPRVKKLF